MMACEIENRKTESISTGTEDSSQKQGEADTTSLKDGAPSDSTPSASSSESITSGIKGETNQESIENQESGPKSLTLENQNDLESTDEDSNSTSNSPKCMPDIKKEKIIPKKVPHIEFNLSTAGRPRAHNLVGKSPSLASQKRHVFSTMNNLQTRRAVSLHDRPMSRDKLSLSREHKMSRELTCDPSSASQKCVLPHTDYRTTRKAVEDRPMTRDNFSWYKELEMSPQLKVVEDRPITRDNFSWYKELEMSPQIICGPRCYDRNLDLESSPVKQTFGFAVSRDKYNLPDFQTKYENAKFYVIKSFNEDDVHKSIKYNVWTSTSYGNNKLNAAFLDAEAKSSETGKKCPVFLFFSVNTSGQFVGVAEMIGPVDFNKDMDFWKTNKYNGFFPIKWHILKDVPNTQFRYIILPNNDNHRVTYSRDTQEVELKQGTEMLNIFKRYLAKTSMLDDYDFYVNREKLFRAQSNTKHTNRAKGSIQHRQLPNDDFRRGREDEFGWYRPSF